MKKFITKMMATLVALTLCLSLAAIPAEAAEATVSDAAAFQTAVENAAAGDTIKLTGDIVLDSTFKLEKNVIIDGQNQYTISTDSAKKTFEVYSSATFQNVTITNSYAAGRAIDTRVGDITVNLNNVTLKATGSANVQTLNIGGSGSNIVVNMTGCTLEGATGYAITTFNPVQLNITGSDVSGFAALYMKGADSSLGSAGSVVTVKGSVLSSKNNNPVSGNTFATVVYEDNNITVNVDGASKITADSTATPAGDYQYVIGFGTKYGAPNASGNVFNAAEGVVLEGYTLLAGNTEKNTLTVPAEYAAKLTGEGNVVKTLADGRVTTFAAAENVEKETVDAAIQDAVAAGEDAAVELGSSTTVAISIPTASIESVTTAGKAVEVTAAAATVTFDQTALEAVNETISADAAAITLVVEEVPEADHATELTEKQQETIEKLAPDVVISAKLIDDQGTVVSDFKGGKVTVAIPFTPSEGGGSDYTVAYIANDGKITNMNATYEDGKLVFVTNHFSEYVVVKAAVLNEVLTQTPPTGDSAYAVVLCCAMVAALGGVAVLVANRKRFF